MNPLQHRLVVLGFIVVWTSGYVVGALATSSAEPLAIVFWRFAFAAVAFGLLAIGAHDRWPQGYRAWSAVAVAGIALFAVQFGGLYIGLREGMPAATTALIACSAPLLVAGVTAALRWERLGRRGWMGIALGIVGVAVTLADRVGRPPSITVAAWTALGLAGLAGGTLLQSRLRVDAGRFAIPAVQSAASTVVLAVWAPLAGGFAIPLTGKAIGSLGWLAVICTIGGPLLLYSLIRTDGPTRASSNLFVVPAATAIAAWPVLGDRLGPTAIVGLAIGATGMLLLSRRRSRSEPGGFGVRAPHVAQDAADLAQRGLGPDGVEHRRDHVAVAIGDIDHAR